MTKNNIARYYYIVVGILFFFLGMEQQSGLLPRIVPFLVYGFFFVSYVFFVLSDKSINNKIFIFFDIRDYLLMTALFSYMYSIFMNYNEGVTDKHECVMRALIPIFLYIFGRFFVIYDNNNCGKNTVNIVMSYGLGLMVFNLVSIFSYYIYENNNYFANNRVWFSILYPTHYMNATIYSYYPLIIISLFIYSVICYREKIIQNTIIILSSVFSAVWFWVVPKTRMPGVVFVFSIIMGIVLLITNYILKKEIYKEKKKVIGILAFFLLFVVIGYWCINLFVFKSEWYETSILVRDGGLLNNVRFKWSKQAIFELRQYPFGGNHTTYDNMIASPHVAWVDIAYCSGIIPFVAIIIWLMLSFADLVKICFSSNIYILQKMILILPFFATFLYTCTEPLRTMNYPLCSVVLFAGMIRGQVLYTYYNLQRK